MIAFLVGLGVIVLSDIILAILVVWAFGPSMLSVVLSARRGLFLVLIIACSTATISIAASILVTIVVVAVCFLLGLHLNFVLGLEEITWG